ncbi:MAG: hypothetical protein QHC40_00585 [Sphingobium sp.]|nr:hypothetical protein [Sphingobium sp.]
MLSLLLTGTAIAGNGDGQDRSDQERSSQERPAEQRQERPRDQTLDKAGRIASQPARDAGIAKTEIPSILKQATEAPYAMPPSRTCKGLNAAMAELTAALGPDFGNGTGNNESRTGKIIEAGGRTVINSLIPFRGLVREVTGAAPAQRRLEAAISTGIARRGFLRGLATAKGCKITG